MNEDNSVFSLLAKRVDWLGQKQATITRNIANSDTPDYKPMELRESEFQRAVQQATNSSLQPKVTKAGHLLPSGQTAGAVARESRQHYEESPAGNAVVLEKELVAMGQTQAQHELMVAVYKKYLSIMKLAIGAGRR